MSWSSRASSILCAVCLSSAAPVVHASPSGDALAAKYKQQGREAYAAEKYDAAAAAFEKAYSIEPAPELLYATAQAKRLGGHCREAVALYNEFLAANPDPQTASLAKEAKSLCADVLAAEVEEEEDEASEEEELVEEEPIDEPPPPILEEPQDDPVRDEGGAHWYQDPLGGALVGVGVAGVGAGIGLLVAARVEGGKDSPNYGDFGERQQRVKNFRIAGGVVLGLGAALLVAGGVRWGLLGVREKRNGTSAGLLLDSTTAGLSLRGRF